MDENTDAVKLAELGLSAEEFSVLDVLDDDDEGWLPLELVGASGLTSEETARVIRTLIDRGLAGRRGPHITLTDSGTALSATARKALGLERMRDWLDDTAAAILGALEAEFGRPLH